MKLRFINSDNIHSVKHKLEMQNWTFSILVDGDYSHYWHLSFDAKEVQQINKDEQQEYETYELNKDKINNLLLIE